ncbi:hypothetical protein L1049_001072 [Liquidambar formosana]|uniref:Ribosomal protein L39 n=1 Tax=Liquidambar formosana TaxID=63359 RepID=A0AAP0NC66_LIQFO
MRQNRPIPHWIRMRTDNTIREDTLKRNQLLNLTLPEALSISIPPLRRKGESVYRNRGETEEKKIKYSTRSKMKSEKKRDERCLG